jgi:hypothetical protein
MKTAQLRHFLVGRLLVGRRSFAIAAVGLLAAKVLLDRAFLQYLGVPWNDWLGHALGLYLGFDSIRHSDQDWALPLLAASLPFLWIGLALTSGRLRSIHWPAWLVILVFVPGLKLLFFIALLLLPDTRAVPTPGTRARPKRGRWIPKSRLGAAAVGVTSGGVLGLAAIALITGQLREYGWSLFVATPFLVGLVSTLLYTWHEPRGRMESVGVALLALGLLGVALVGVAIEGLICLLMASPIAVGLGILGALAGHGIGELRGRRDGELLLGAALLLPMMGLTEKVAAPAPEIRPVRTEIVVAAPPSTVWRHVVEFSDLPPPTELIFRTGIAYPIRARIEGKGPGAVRKCEFSTGPFVEPIQVWDEPRLLRFSVTANPAPMEEWTPYRHIHPPHLDGFLVSKRGQFELFPTGDGGTRLVGTTWYQHGLLPERYWRVWSDHILHTIHLRVLNHIRALSEAEVLRAAVP